MPAFFSSPFFKQWGFWIISIIATLLLPLHPFFRDIGVLTILNLMGIQITFAVAYNMLLGQGGMLSFGHAVYFGLGGFFAAHIMNAVEYDGWFIPLPFMPFIAAVFGLAAAAIIGSFSTRRAGTVFAMISLGVGELLAASSITFVSFFGGEEGVSADRTMGPKFFGSEFLSDLSVFYLIIFWTFFSLIFMLLFSKTPAGRMANAVRDNPERAEFIGYSQRWVRYITFCASGFFAGAAGGLFAVTYEILTEANMNLFASGNVLLMTYLGGTGYFLGPILGAALMTVVQSVVISYTDLWQLYLGVVFILAVMFAPRGLAGILYAHRPAFLAHRLQPLGKPYAAAAASVTLFVLSVVALCELFYHARFGAVGDHLFTLYVFTVDSSSVFWWAAWIIGAGGGAWLSWRFFPEALQSFDDVVRPLANAPTPILPAKDSHDDVPAPPKPDPKPSNPS